MKGRNEKRNYGKAFRKNLKIDKENSEKLFKEKDNKEKSNFVTNLFSIANSSFEHVQRTPCSILAPLINSYNSIDDFHPIKKKAHKNAITLFDSPVTLCDTSFISEDEYNEEITKKNGYISSKKNKKRTYRKKNLVVEKFVEQCNIDWSEIEDFKLVVEKASKKGNETPKQEEILPLKENSLFKNCFQTLYGVSDNASNIKENVENDILKQETISIGKTTISAVESENTDSTSICISKAPNDVNFSAENITNNKCQCLDFESVSNVRESTFCHILTNNALKSKKGLTTSTPNITPGKFLYRDADLYVSHQKTNTLFKSQRIDQYSKPPLSASYAMLGIQSQQLLDCGSNVNNLISVNESSSFNSKCNNLTCTSQKGKSYKELTHHSISENDLCSISKRNNFSRFYEIPVQCTTNVCSEYSYAQQNITESDYSKELFNMSSLTEHISELQKNSAAEIQFARSHTFEEENLHKNLWSDGQNISQDRKYLTLHSMLSDIHEDSYNINPEAHTSACADSSNENKSHLSTEQNQLKLSVTCKLQNSDSSDESVSDMLEIACEFKSYCEFISFTNSVVNCRDEVKEHLAEIEINSLEALEDMLSSESNFIEEHASIIVLTLCNQTAVIPFADVMSPEMMSKVSKIGEGVYGEVFCYESENIKHVYKIVPIEGNIVVNAEEQKNYKEIMSEMLISLELSILSQASNNMAPNFIQVENIYCASGKYPDALLQEWDRYAELKYSENDKPDIFPEDQHFILFQFAYGGIDLESAELKNATEAKSVFQQVAFALAVAEQALEFEHRDLHWGNILVSTTKQEKVEYIFQDEYIMLPTDGVLVSIIDFTLSYLRKDGCTIFTSLAEDPTLFTGEGDYQFDIYRMMKENNGNNWEIFNPYSNVLWLDYLLKKLLKEKKYKNYKKHQASKLQLQKWEKSLLTYKSATSFVIDAEFFHSTRL